MGHLAADIKFSIVPEWLLDSGVSDRAVRVYAVLARYADSETLEAFPSRQTLAERCHCHVKSIDRAIRELEEIKALTRRHRNSSNGFASNLYILRRVGTGESPGRDTGVARVGTPQSLGRDTAVHLTRTNELEPKELEPVRKPKPAKADDYQPSLDILDKASTDFPGLNLQLELQKFVDHHAAKGSKFADWDRAFRNWLRRAWEWSPLARQARANSELDEFVAKVAALEEAGDYEGVQRLLDGRE